MSKSAQKRLQRFAILAGLMLVLSSLLGFTPMQTTPVAYADSWPTTEGGFEQMFQVQNLDGCYTTKKEGNGGFEGHGNSFKLLVKGDGDWGVVIHGNPGHYSWPDGRQPQYTGKTSTGGDRFVVKPGESYWFQTTGDCNTGASFYPDYPPQAAAPVAQAPQGGSFSVPAQGSPIYPSGAMQSGCPTFTSQIPGLTGGTTAESDWMRIAPNGFKYRGSPATLTTPSQFSGARIDYFLPGTRVDNGRTLKAFPGQQTEAQTPEATLWIADCNP